MKQQLQHQQQTIFDVVSRIDSLTGPNAAAFKRIFRVSTGQARAHVGQELAAKYKVEQDNVQHVVSVTNLQTLEQTYYNQSRTAKPQTFNNTTPASSIDPTNNGANCDFCKWQTLTARDPGFGRIQLPHAVTGSNLFKYAEPCHGIVLFRQHDPLAFTQAALSDLLDASWLWFQESHKLNPQATEPYLLWNCLPRAGASQYHGHAQVMLSTVAVPGMEKLQRAATHYQQQHPGHSYYEDLVKAHAAVGLVRQVSVSGAATASHSSDSPQGGGQQQQQQQQQQPRQGGQQQVHSSKQQQQQQQHVAWAVVSVAPVKDMEVMVIGRHISCPAWQRLLHAALRGLVDGLGVATFNVGVLNIDLTVPAPAGVGLERVWWPSADSTSQEEDSRGSSSGNPDGSLQLPLASSSEGHYQYGSSSSSDGLWLPDASYWADKPPVIARLASRGKLSNAASDFGGLEVWGGASIGHTDPFTVVQQLDAQLAAGVGFDGVAGCVVNN